MKKLLFLLSALALALPVAAGDFPKGSPNFEHSYSAALSQAKSSGKPAVLVFSASWCGPCQAMKKDVYPSADVKKFHDKFVWAYIDVDESSNEAASKQFGVSAIPHIQFVTAEGKPVDKQVGSSSASDFAKTLAAVLKKAGAK